jgi:PIN domain nuclease of toxin-antitoxin system
LKCLLDTQLLIWVSLRSGLLSVDAHELITNPETEVVFSAISIWEVAIKRAMGRKEFDVDPRALRRGLRENGYSELDFTSDHAFVVADLPLIHKDPFDRALVAQAISEGITLLTSDRVLARYPGGVRKI